MNKIASPRDLEGELRQILAYCETSQPSRTVVASRLRELADQVVSTKAVVSRDVVATGLDLRQMVHKPAEADESLGSAYRSLINFKLSIDAMQEIPTYLKPHYNQTLKSIDKIVSAQKETYQLRMMLRKLSF